jgi:hypothetical protein
MVRSTCRIICVIIAIFTGLLIASTDANVDKRMMKHFEVNWESMRYNKSVTQYNPEVSSNQQPSGSNESLTLTCEIEIKDPNRVLGVLRQGVITEITDSKKQNIEIDQESFDDTQDGELVEPLSQVSHMPYEGLHYQRRYTQPPVIPRWRALLRKFLRIPQTPFRPELITELQPTQVQFDLDLGLLEQTGGEIKSVKGYFYALVAESTEYVDVPFEPNDRWVSLTDEVAIQVKEANCTISGSSVRYNFNIEESQQRGRSTGPLRVGDYLPEKIVMDRQLIAEDDKQINRSMGFGFLPAYVGGSTSGSSSGPGGISPVKKIRFVIAVKPKHCKIPFDLKNIPLPNPESKEEKE